MRKAHGWIDIKSVTTESGEPANLETEKDIFFWDEPSDRLKVGDEVTFIVEPDMKRGGTALMARRIRQTARSMFARIAQGGIELSVNGLQGGRMLMQSSVFMSWCLSPALAAQVRKAIVERDQVAMLLVVWWPSGNHSKHTEQRKMVDLSDPMTSIAFSAGGASRIVAYVVEGPTEERLRNYFLGRENGWYATSLVGYGEMGMEERAHVRGSGHIEVEVPEELFATRPRDWAYVNYFFSQSPRDQCAYRRRRWLAYTIQPLVFLLIAAFLTIVVLATAAGAIISLAFGARNLDFSFFRHPLALNPNSVWSEVRWGRFSREFRGVSVPILMSFSPGVIGIAVAIMVVFVRNTPFLSPAWFEGLLVIECVLALVITLYSIAKIAWLSSTDRYAARAETRIERRRLQLLEEVDNLICQTTGPRTPDVWELPFTVKTVRFYAAALKQKVCKPFAA